MEENNEFKNPENVENSNNVDSNNNQPQKSPKAKKIIAGVACVVVVAGVITGVALNKDKVFTNKNNNNTTIGQNSTQNEETKKIDESKPWVYDAEYLKENKKIYQDSAKTEEYAVNSDKDLVVPYININSDYAKTVNDTIKALYDDYYTKYGTDVIGTKYGNGYRAIYHYELGYKKYINDNILSVIITLKEGAVLVDGGTGGGTSTTYTYNFNLDTLDEAILSEMAVKCGFSSEYEVTSKIKEWEEKQRVILGKANFLDIFNGVENGKYFIDENGKLNFLYRTSTSSSVEHMQPIEKDKEIEFFYTEEDANEQIKLNNELLQNQTTTNNNTTTSSTQNININDYIGTWYRDKNSYGYDDVIISKDEKNNLNVTFGFYRLTTFDKINAKLEGDTIFLDGYDYDEGVSGTIKLENNRIVLNYKTASSENQEWIFNYRMDNKVAEKYERDNPVGTIEIIDKDDSSFIYNLSVTNAIRGQEYPNGNVNVGGVTGVAVKNGDNTYVDEISSGYASKIYWLKFSFKDDNTVVVTEEEGFSAESGFFGAGVYATGTFKK